MNSNDITKATHEDAVKSLITNSNEIWLKVRHERQPAGLRVKFYIFFEVELFFSE